VTEYDGEGVCDDGGEGSEWGACALGSDCDDCGPREWEESMEDSPAIAGGDGSDSERGMTESDVRGANGGGSASGGGGVAQPSQQGKTAVQSNPTLGTISTLSGMLGVKAMFTPPPPPPPNNFASFFSSVTQSLDAKLSDNGLGTLFTAPPPPPPDVLHTLLFD